VRVRSSLRTRTKEKQSQKLISSAFPTLANSVGINGRAATTCQRADGRPLLPTSYAANECAGTDASRGCQLIPMLCPKTPAMFVAVANARVMRVRIVPVPVP
jgi:hypothetical protein